MHYPSILSLVLTMPFIGALSVRSDALDRASNLIGSNSTKSASQICWDSGDKILNRFHDRLGCIGLIEPLERKNFIIALASVCIIVVSISAVIGFRAGERIGLIVGLILGLYLSCLGVIGYLKSRYQRHNLKVLGQIPLLLEGIILLVESGLGLLPALQGILDSQDESSQRNAAIPYLRLVYKLTANGLPFSEALATVAKYTPHRVIRHVLLHLDVSGSDGGELVPALRSLSNHAHTEWRLAVERKVKQLENLVVFPVFICVIGLSFLIAAVPLVPILNLREVLTHREIQPVVGPQMDRGLTSPIKPSSIPTSGG